MIADEVQSGVGRTGKWWGIEHFGIEPDIVTIAKGIASGVPLGICAAKESFVDWEKGAHGNTYGGNPLACAAALATLDLVENGYMQNAAEVGEFTLDNLEEIKSRHQSIGDVRGVGLMIGVDFVKDQATKQANKLLRDRIVDLAFENGLLTLGCGDSTIRVAPPLCITKTEMEECLYLFEKSVTQAEKEF